MINERIRKIRDYYELSQREFAKRTDIGASTLAMFETGDRKPKDIHLNRICSEFNISKPWLEKRSRRYVCPSGRRCCRICLYVPRRKNDFFDLILATMRSYKNLDRSGREVLCKTSADIKEHIISEYLKMNIQKKKTINSSPFSVSAC